MDKLIANDAKDTICMKMYNVHIYHSTTSVIYTKFRQIFGYSQVPLKTSVKNQTFTILRASEDVVC